MYRSARSISSLSTLFSTGSALSEYVIFFYITPCHASIVGRTVTSQISVAIHTLPPCLQLAHLTTTASWMCSWSFHSFDVYNTISVGLLFSPNHQHLPCRGPPEQLRMQGFRRGQNEWCTQSSSGTEVQSLSGCWDTEGIFCRITFFGFLACDSDNE